MTFSSQTILTLSLTTLATLNTASGEITLEGQHEVSCPPEQEITLSMAGTIGGGRLVDAWQQEYTKHCPGFNITIQQNSWDAAAARVCDSSLLYSPVDIAGMGGSFFQPQASTEDGWNFLCKRSTLSRESILLHVGQEGVVVGASKHGVAASCIDLMGEGLSKDQIRWIFSDFTAKQLIANGWDSASVPFSDGDDTTHYWSELNENCTSAEILLADEENGVGSAVDYFYEHVLTARGENLRDHFSTSSDDAMDDFLHENGGAVAIFHLYDMISHDYQGRDLMAAGIKDAGGVVVKPTDKTFESGTYPFLKKVYLGLVKDPAALNLTRPFIEFGLSDEGSEILKQSGYWPLRGWEKTMMYSRIGSNYGFNVEKEIQEHCGPKGGQLSIAGAETVLPVVNVWTELYNLGCPTTIELDRGGSKAGAYRVCASPESGDLVDIGMMSRDFDQSEAVERKGKNNFIHDCIVDKGEASRSVIQIDIAMDGVTLVLMRGSTGERCVSLLGGLTFDQLRWMFSSYSDSELQKSGWDPRSLKNNDFDSKTHLWSELDERCEDKEIEITGDSWGDGSFTLFSEKILKDFGKGETIARDRDYVEVEALDSLMYLLDHDDAITFVGYHFFFEHQDVFWAPPIATKEGSPFVYPTLETFSDGSYPLVRTVFVNLLNDEKSLVNSVPMLDFGFDHPELVEATGYAPLHDDLKMEMLERLYKAPYLKAQTGEDETSSSLGIIFGAIFGALIVITLIVVVVIYVRKY